MAIRKTEAIILRRQEIRETSLVLTAFSREIGKFLGLIKGVRGMPGAAPWFVEPLTLQSVVLYERKRSPWALVSVCDLLDPFDPIRRDLRRTAHAAVCLDLVDAMTEPWDSHPEIFELLLNVLKGMARGGDSAALVPVLEARLLQASGLLPDTESLPLSPEGKGWLKEALQSPVEELRFIPPAGSAEAQIGRVLQGLCARATERPLKSRIFLHSIDPTSTRPSSLSHALRDSSGFATGMTRSGVAAK